MKKILKWTLIVLAGLFVLTVLAGLALYPGGKEQLSRTYPNIPVEKVNIPAGPAAITRGRHVAAIRGCAKCHGDDLSGSLLANDRFLGTTTAANLTSGKGGVGGSYSDADWVRAIRHGVKPDGHVAAFMTDYYSLSDQDLGDLLAYLKQIPPVDAVVPALRLGLLDPLAPALGIYTPPAGVIDHNAPRPADPAPGATVEYGRYLSSMCTECHSSSLPGKLKGWTLAEFTHAMRSGVLPDGKKIGPAMTAKSFIELDDAELAALFLYFTQSRP